MYSTSRINITQDARYIHATTHEHNSKIQKVNLISCIIYHLEKRFLEIYLAVMANECFRFGDCRKCPKIPAKYLIITNLRHLVPCRFLWRHALP